MTEPTWNGVRLPRRAIQIVEYYPRAWAAEYEITFKVSAGEYRAFCEGLTGTCWRCQHARPDCTCHDHTHGRGAE